MWGTKQVKTPDERATPGKLWRRLHVLTAAIAGSIALLFIVPDFELVPAKMPVQGGTLFGLSDYVAALALLLVVLTISDFRFRYRVRLLPRDIRTWAFWAALAVGALILLTDYWFLNALPIPDFLNSLLNIKLMLAAVFLGFVFYLNFIAFIRPPIFKASSAEHYARVLFNVVGEGNKDKLAVVAEELGRSLPNILKLASEVPRRRRGDEPPKVTKAQGYAHDLLMMLGDPRFCDVVATQTPWLAADFFWLLRDHKGAATAASAFSCNVSTALIMNRSSTLHQEGSFFSGLIGELRPISNAVYGSWEVVEACSSGGLGPFDISYTRDEDMGQPEADVLVHVALLFADDYFAKTKGEWHSVALARIISKFEGMGRWTYRLNEIEDYGRSFEYAQLSAAVDFAVGLVELLGKHDVAPRSPFGRPEPYGGCPYDRIAQLYFELICGASIVTSEKWVNWAVQHNLVWSKLFSRGDFPAMPIIKRKVVRMIWDEIKKMTQYGNFMNARLLGLCLNVLGVTKPKKTAERRREFYALHWLVVTWTEKNYHRLMVNQPKVAAAVPNGSLTFDAEKHRFVKTYSSELRKKPNRRYLPIIVGEVAPDPEDEEGDDD